MRIVFDTNVIVSALLTPGGTCDQVVSLVGAPALQPCVDGRLMAEYEEVLHRDVLPISTWEADRQLDDLVSFAHTVAAMPLKVRLPHAGDLPFLEVAATAQAVLVTGNLRHFPKKQRAGVRVVTPAELLDVLRERA